MVLARRQLDYIIYESNLPTVDVSREITDKHYFIYIYYIWIGITHTSIIGTENTMHKFIINKIIFANQVYSCNVENMLVLCNLLLKFNLR